MRRSRRELQTAAVTSGNIVERRASKNMMMHSVAPIHMNASVPSWHSTYRFTAKSMSYRAEECD